MRADAMPYSLPWPKGGISKVTPSHFRHVTLSLHCTLRHSRRGRHTQLRFKVILKERGGRRGASRAVAAAACSLWGLGSTGWLVGWGLAAQRASMERGVKGQGAQPSCQLGRAGWPEAPKASLSRRVGKGKGEGTASHQVGATYLAVKWKGPSRARGRAGPGGRGGGGRKRGRGSKGGKVGRGKGGCKKRLHGCGSNNSMVSNNRKTPQRGSVACLSGPGASGTLRDSRRQQVSDPRTRWQGTRHRGRGTHSCRRTPTECTAAACAGVRRV